MMSNHTFANFSEYCEFSDKLSQFYQILPDAPDPCDEAFLRLQNNVPTKTQIIEFKTEVENHIDSVWVMIILILIFSMQLGFILLEAGAVRKKNVQNILFKNLVDMFISSISFWFIGYKWSILAYGGVIGSGSNFSLTFRQDDFVSWLTGLFFCNTASTIVSGSLAERVLLDTYVFFTMTMCTVIYPVVASWVWGGGWLSQLGFIDHAGSGVVHLVGGVCGLVGTYRLGPRIGAFENAKREQFVKSRNKVK